MNKMECIILSLKQANDSSWMKSLQENGQYEFLIRTSDEWTSCENKVYDMISELSGLFVGSAITLEQHRLWVADRPEVVQEWLPNLHLQEERYYFWGIRVPRFLGMLLAWTDVVRTRWRFEIKDLKEA